MLLPHPEKKCSYTILCKLMVHAKLAVGETQVFLPRDLNFKHVSWGLVCVSYLSVIAYSCFFSL